MAQYRSKPKPNKQLTPREREIVRTWFANGASAIRAARLLGVTDARIIQVVHTPAGREYAGQLEAIADKRAVDTLTIVRLAILTHSTPPTNGQRHTKRQPRSRRPRR